MKYLITHYLKPCFGRMSYGFLIKFIGTVVELCLPWILAYMIDSVIPAKNREAIYLWDAALSLVLLSSLPLLGMVPAKTINFLK